MSSLALFLLGSPRVERDGVVVEQKLRKVIALLAYLVVTGQRHNRDTLAELLNPEGDRDNSRADIRRSLSILRGWIGAERVCTDRAAAWFGAGEGVWIDVQEYRRLAAFARGRGKSKDLRQSAASLAQAALLYRGEFLSGFSLRDSPGFEEWQLAEAESLRREQAAVLGALVKVHEDLHELPKAIEWSRSLLALDPVEEASHRCVIRLLALSGQRPAALRQYERCEAVLKRELGIGPDPETVKLRVAIASGQLLPAKASERPAVSVRRKERKPRAPAARIEGEEALAVILATGQQDAPCLFFATVYAAAEAAIEKLRSAQAGAQAGARQVLRGVGMAIHAGRLQPGEQGPGEELMQRTLLILGASNPGQVLLSGEALEVAREELPEGVSFSALGAHRLSDLGPAVHVFELLHPDVPAVPAALKTLDSLPNNLPGQPTPFIGRTDEIKAVLDRLRPSEVRLLTLTGPGGTGKTRLALQASAVLVREFRDGVHFIDLAALRDPVQVAAAICGILGASEPESRDRTLLDILKDHLRKKELLLVLDNFEHLLPAAKDVAGILSACPLVKAMVTSREALHLRAEHELPVAPLQLPQGGESAERLVQIESIRLFQQRAAAARPDFRINAENAAAVADICVRLDGLPLALELAAAKLASLTVPSLLERLDHRLSLLTGGARDLPDRQQTLRGEIDWSHEMLDQSEKLLFRRLSVFVGGLSPNAAQSVCSLPSAGAPLEIVSGLTSLVQRSLLVREEAGGELRYRMLHTIREYARERLDESGEAEEVEQRFAAYHTGLAELAEPMLYGAEQEEWLDRLESENENMRGALEILHRRGARIDAMRLAGALGWFWLRRGHFAEGHQWLELVRAGAEADDPAGLRAKVTFLLGYLHTIVGRAYLGNPETRTLFQESVDLFRNAGDSRGAARALALSSLQVDFHPEADKEDTAARAASVSALVQESVALARSTGDPWTIAFCLSAVFSSGRWMNNIQPIKAAELEEATALARKTGDPFLLSKAVYATGVYVADAIGDHLAAIPWFEEALRIAREMRSECSILDVLHGLGYEHLILTQLPQAKALFGEGLLLSVELSARGYLQWFFGAFDHVARKEGRGGRAARLMAAAQRAGEPGIQFKDAVAGLAGPPIELVEEEWNKGFSMTLDEAVAYALSDKD